MSRPRTWFVSDFERPARRIARAWLLPVLVVMVTVSHVAALAAGAWIQRDQDQRLARHEAAKPKRAEPAPATALTQWSCSRQEFREYQHACAQRKRSELIEKINPNTKGKS
jgi:hypothetical protein